MSRKDESATAIKEAEMPKTQPMRRSPGGQLLADLLTTLSARLRYLE